MNAFDFFFEQTKDIENDFVIGPNETVTYRNLYSKCLKISSYLNTVNIESNNILLIAPNSVFFIAAYLGILKSGRVVIPLSPEIEQSNLDYIQDKCKASIVFTTSRIAKKLDFHRALIIDEKSYTELPDFELVQESSPTTSHSLAEIIFTSGSTGDPKGVMISHQNLIANTTSIINYLQLAEEDIMMVVLPFYYCYGLSLLHTHLRVGGSIVLNNMFIMMGTFIDDLKRFKCTGFAGVPSHFQILLRKSDTFKVTEFPDLRYVTQAGGKLHDAFIQEFITAFPNTRFYVMYGQTEATARLSWLPPEKLSEKIGSCGIGIPGVNISVVDETGYPVKPGEVGEIIASGENIMLGYYMDPDSTSQILKDGWLYTGDLAVLDDEGYLYLKARKKEIIKVGGRRISPKEVEEVIVSMPEVIDCEIIKVSDELLGEAMKALITIKEAARDNFHPADVKKYCAGKLSTFKIPQIIEFQFNLSISATGKKIKKSQAN